MLYTDSCSACDCYVILRLLVIIENPRTTVVRLNETVQMTCGIDEFGIDESDVVHLVFDGEVSSAVISSSHDYLIKKRIRLELFK